MQNNISSGITNNFGFYSFVSDIPWKEEVYFLIIQV